MKQDILNLSFLRNDKFTGFQIPEEPKPLNIDVSNVRADFSYDGKKASFNIGGKEYWVIDPSRFADTAHLEVIQNQNVIRIKLSNAFYPGTKFPADFYCEVNQGNAGSIMNIQFTYFMCQVSLEEWLVGKEELISSEVQLHTSICQLAPEYLLNFSGITSLKFFPNWSFRLKGKGISVLKGRERHICSDSAYISLPDPNQNSLFSAPSTSRTLISLVRDDLVNWSFKPWFHLPKGWNMSHPENPFDEILIETELSKEGGIRSAFLAQPTNGKKKWELTLNTESFSIFLTDMYYAEAFDTHCYQEALIGYVDSEAEWCHTDDCSLLLGTGPNTPPFEIIFRNGNMESAVIVQEIKGISAPLKGLVTETKWTGNGNLVAILPEKLNIKAPEHIQVEGVIRFSSIHSETSLHINANFEITVIRPEDMLVLGFKFINLSFKNGNSRSAHFERVDNNKPAYLVVLFPPQHIAEQTFSDVKEIHPDQPASSRMAGPSRLVFCLPSNMKELPYSMKALLDWSSYDLSVSPAAREPNNQGNPVTVLNKPEEFQTSIEAPYRLFISPNESSGWARSLKPITANGYTELWHSRLGVKINNDEIDEGENHLRTIRAIWSKDYETSWPLDKPFPTTLNSEHRNEIVQQSASFPQNLKPIEVKRLMLSSLGAWLNVHGCWEGEDYILREWQHQAVMGRDQYVKVVNDGFLFPFGHKASLIEVSERIVSQNENQENIAYLHKRRYVIVRESEKIYPLEDTPESRQFPFTSVKITNLVTPDQKEYPNGKSYLWIKLGEPNSDPNSDPYYHLHIIMEDVEKQKAELTMPLAFVERDISATNMKNLINDFNKAIDKRTTEQELNGQKISFAQSEKPGDTTFVTNNLTFGSHDWTGKTNKVLLNGIKTNLWKNPPFFPNIAGAQVRNTAIEQIAGHDKGIDIVLNPIYLENAFDETKNIGGILAHLKNPVGLPFPANLSGGLVTPQMNMVAISRSMGPVGGLVDSTDPNKMAANFIEELKNKAKGCFDPKKFLSDEAKILGSIPLNTVIGDVDLLKGDSKENVPQLITRPIYPKKTDGTEDKDAMPIAIETKLLWKPKLKKDLLLLEFDENSTLSIEAIINSRVANPPEFTYEITGELKNFKMSLLTTEPFLIITFNQLTFKAKSGQKTTIVPDIKNIEFSGALEFLKTVQELLKSIGEGPSIEALPSGVKITNKLAIPTLSLGILAIQNMTLSSELNLPFDGQLQFSFNFCTRENPFILTVGIFGGGGFFGITLVPDDIQLLEASLEFGGSLALNLGVAQGSAHLMAGIYFKMEQQENKPKTCELSGYVRCGGSLEVLGIISISAEFYLGLCYRKPKAWGQATLTVQVEVLFFSTSVDLKIEKEFSGTDADPPIAEMLDESQWIEYSCAFA